MPDAVKLTLEQRRERLQEAIASQMVPGMTIEAQTDISASLAFTGGLRRIFTVAEDGTVGVKDFPPDTTTAHQDSPNPVTRPMGPFVKLLIIVGALVGVGYLAANISSVSEQQRAGVTKENPWFTMRSRDEAIEITLRNGAEALTDATVVINDRWTCDVGAVQRNTPVEIQKHRCLTSDGFPMPSEARAIEVSLRSPSQAYWHTQTFTR